MTKIKIEYELCDIKKLSKDLQNRKANQGPPLDDLIFGKLFLIFDGVLIKSPYSKEDNIDYTDTLWLLKTFKDILKLLSTGIIHEIKRVPFLDNPINLGFVRNDSMIELSLNLYTNNGEQKIISTVVDEKNLVESCVKVSEKLKSDIIVINPALISDESIIQFDKLIQECENQLLVNNLKVRK